MIQVCISVCYRRYAEGSGQPGIIILEREESYFAPNKPGVILNFDIRMKIFANGLEIRIAALYALFGGLWILLSDQLLAALFTDVSVLTKVQTYKGSAYVLVSALLIFILLRRELNLRRRIEHDHTIAEERYRLLFENSRDAILFSMPDGRVLSANPAACRMFGRTEAELMELGREGIMDVGDPRLDQALNERVKTGSFHGEMTFLRKDGSGFPGEVSSAIFKDGDGNERTTTTIRDVTERKQAEEKLAYQAFLLEHVNDAILATDGERVITSWNLAAEKMFGWTKEEAIGRPAYEIINTEITYEQHEGAMKQLAETGEYKTSTRVTRKDGSKTWVEGVNNTLRGRSGEIIGYISINRDITENKLAEEARRVSEERLQGFFDNAASLVWIKDLDGRFVKLNRFTAQVLGRAPEEILGRSVAEIFPQNEADAYSENDRQALDAGRALTFEETAMFADGLHTFVSIKFPLWDAHGKMYGLGAICTDITERKQAELALQESEKFLKESQRIANMGSWQLDLLTNKAYWSENCYNLYGFAPYEIEPSFELFKSMVYPEDRLMIQVVLAEILQNPQSLQREFRILDKSRRPKWVLTNITPTVEGGQVVRLTGIQIDITDRKEAEQETKRQLERLNALHSIDIAISGSVDLRTNLGILLDHVLSVMEVDAADILLAHPQSPSLDFLAGRGFRTRRLELAYVSLGGNMAGRAALQQKTMRHYGKFNPETDERLASLSASEGFVSYIGVPLFAKGQLKGVLEIHHRSRLETDNRWEDFLVTLAGQAAIAIDISQLFTSLQRSNVELAMAYDATIEGWSHALDLRDKETEGHTQRVTSLTVELAHTIGISGAEIVQIRRGALLHDIGKMGVPDHILLKPGKLTDEEWEKMRLHPVFAYELLSPINFLRGALDIPYCHHEKWDGTGYPRGLKGEEIPLSARIFAVVDVWDALTNDRPYRQAWSKEKALAYIREQSGAHFDPKVVEMFLLVMGFNGAGAL